MLLARAYGNLYYVFEDWFGLSIPILKIVQSYGFMVAMGFVVSAWLLSKDLKRKGDLGIIPSYEIEEWVGKPVSIKDLLINFVIGFLIGFKFIPLIFGDGKWLEHVQEYIVSSEGSWIGGLVVGLIFVGIVYYQNSRQRLAEPKKEKKLINPVDMVGNITVTAAIGGIAGAKLFYLFETPGNFEQFINDPLGTFFAGLTIYGGIIGGMLTTGWYVKSKGISFLQIADTLAPILLIGYGLGRMGCQLSGDGDWGIANLHDKPGWLTWLPDWLWKQDYAHGVTVGGDEGYFIEGCEEMYCLALKNPVFPTPIYEFIMVFILFVFMWSIRGKIKIPGVMFSFYLVLNGIERYFIEQFRVNTKLEIFGVVATQAEVIAAIFILVGIFGIIFFRKKYKNTDPSKAF